MINLFTRTVSAIAQRIAKVWIALNAQRFVAIAFVGLFLLTTSVDNSSLNASTKSMLNDLIERGESGRPVTAGQWTSENRELQGQPGKQAKRIAKESADAVGEMGEIYPGNAKSVLPGLKNRSLESDD